MGGEISHIEHLRSMIYAADSKGNVKSVKLSDCHKAFNNYGTILRGPTSAMAVYNDHILLGDETGFLTIIGGRKHEIILKVEKAMPSKITAISCFGESVFLADNQGKLK